MTGPRGPRAFAMANVAFGGGLADWLIQAREDGMTYEDILIFLHNERGMKVTVSSLRIWVKDAYAERQLAS